jgi:hypothetical protein
LLYILFGRQSQAKMCFADYLGLHRFATAMANLRSIAVVTNGAFTLEMN